MTFEPDAANAPCPDCGAFKPRDADCRFCRVTARAEAQAAADQQETGLGERAPSTEAAEALHLAHANAARLNAAADAFLGQLDRLNEIERRIERIEARLDLVATTSYVQDGRAPAKK